MFSRDYRRGRASYSLKKERFSPSQNFQNSRISRRVPSIMIRRERRMFGNRDEIGEIELWEYMTNTVRGTNF